MKTATLLTITVVLALSLGVSACGSSSSTSSQGTTDAQKVAPEASPGGNPATSNGGSKKAAGGSGPASGSRQGSEAPSEPHFTPPHHHDSGGGSKQFVRKGADNSVQEYGSEASSAEFDEAAAAVHAYLDARAARAWGAACEFLSARMVEGLIEQLASSMGKTSCPRVLEAFNAGAPTAILRRAAQANVAALRAKGTTGFVLFKGAGENFFVPVRREGGHWRVAAVAPSPLP